VAHDLVEALLFAVEKAVDQHAGLVRESHASLVFTRHAPRYSVTVDARARGSRKKPRAISGAGDTPEEAAEELVSQLDTWEEELR
jgi:hypothetical protein